MRGFLIFCFVCLFTTPFFSYAELPEHSMFLGPESRVSERNVKIAGVRDKKLKKVCNSWLGTKYKYGGCSKKGVDCSCLAKQIYKQVYGVELDRRSKDQYKQCKPIKKQRKLKEGDLVFFKINGARISHVGVYLGDGYFIHSSTKSGVVLNNLSEDYYSSHYFKGGRVK